MKKVITIILAIAMMFAMSINSFAADTTVQSVKSNNTSEKTAEGILTKNDGDLPTEDVIYVEITWAAKSESGDGITATGADFKWDGATCSYVAETGSTPTATGYVKYTVDVVNKSNCGITWTVSYEESNSASFVSSLDANSTLSATVERADVDGNGDALEVNTFLTTSVAGNAQSDLGNELKINVTGIKSGADVGALANGSTQTLGTLTCTISKGTK